VTRRMFPRIPHLPTSRTGPGDRHVGEEAALRCIGRACAGERVVVQEKHAVPPRDVKVSGVGSVLACAPETLFGWKLHGLVEFGRGAWRAKDLFDLQLLLGLPLEPDSLKRAVELAFSSRSLPLAALDDFLGRAEWGLSRSGQRKWRTFGKRHPGAPAFLEARERVKAVVMAMLGES